MASDWETFCTAWADELTSSVGGLAGATVHLLDPFDPEALAAANGERHLAVWPEGGVEAQARGIVTNGFILQLAFLIVVWEGAQDATGRLVIDQPKTAEFLSLENDVRTRLFRIGNIAVGGMGEVRPGGVQLPQPAGGCRVFAWRLLVNKAIDRT